MISPVLFVIAVIGIVIQAFFIAIEHKEKYVPAVVLKGLASLCFVIIGCAGYMSCTGDQAAVSFAKKIFIALILGMTGDILLNLRFVFDKIGQKVFLAGIAAFLAGHILYLAALIPQTENLWGCVAIGAVIAAALLAYIFLTMEVKPAFKIFGIFYLGAVIIMTAIAGGIVIANPSVHNIMYAAGAVLFTLSDIVLIFNTFSGTTRFPLRITNLSLYYIGQLLIAFCLFFK